jgi:hypothetical protein
MDKSASGKVDLVAVDGDDELYNAIANAFDLSYWQNDEFNVQLGFNGKANFGVVDNEAGRVGIMKPFRNNFRADLVNIMNFPEQNVRLINSC